MKVHSDRPVKFQVRLRCEEATAALRPRSVHGWGTPDHPTSVEWRERGRDRTDGYAAQERLQPDVRCVEQGGGAADPLGDGEYVGPTVSAGATGRLAGGRVEGAEDQAENQVAAELGRTSEALEVYPSGEMALNKGELAEIADLLSALEARIKPKGWRKALSVAREWGVVAVIPATILTLGIFSLTQWNAANKRLADEAGFEASTNERLKAFERQFIDLRTLIIAAQPMRKQNQDAAKQLLAEARSKTIEPIPASTVERAGRAFIEASSSEATAWPVALDFVAYRTSLNATSRPDPKNCISKPPFANKYYMNDVYENSKPAIQWVEPIIAEENAAHLDLIGHDENTGSKTGPSALLVRGGATNLDMEHARHVVFDGVEIHYSGGPILLEDVIFINCTFVLDRSQQTRELAERVLASTNVSFKAGP